jgi:hypothetical protein
MSDIVISTKSPERRYLGGVKPTPTPEGVAVAITSPA